MIVVKFILYVLALFTTLLWATKMITDCVSAIYSQNFSDESAEKDGIIRLFMIGAIALFWSLIIVL
jgi:hypothetical protein